MMLKEIARQARFAAMQPGPVRFTVGLSDAQQQDVQAYAADLQTFELAADAARRVLHYRKRKSRCHAGRFDEYGWLPGEYEAKAREWERKVREIALQSEIILQRRADAALADRAMLGILLGVAS